MKTSHPFKVINCLSQGFAVAGPPEKRKAQSGKAEIDLEMVVWGMSLDRAVAMAAELNEDSGGHRPPLHD